MFEAHIGLGSNLGDRRKNLRYALDRLEQEPCSVKKVSSLYETQAVNCPGGRFLNAVAVIETAITPDALLDLLLKIEQERGRIRSAQTEARILDLDLLLYGQKIIKTESLTVPHPRMHQRAFVLIPLSEVSPDLEHPTLTAPVDVLAEQVSGKTDVCRIEQDWWGPGVCVSTQTSASLSKWAGRQARQSRDNVRPRLRTLVFGAGASLHVGYPLTRNLGIALVDWAKQNPRPNRLHWIDGNQLARLFPSLEDFEDVISQLESPGPESSVVDLPKWKRGSILAGISEALCEYFDSIRLNSAWLYRRFAEEVSSPGDTVITFNYDVSLETELRKAKKWHIGDGYGFSLGDSVTPPSPVTVLKLHGSTSWVDILFGGAGGGSYGGVGADAPLGARPCILPQDFKFFGYPPEIRDPLFKGGGSDRTGSMILPARSKGFGGRETFWDQLWLKASEALDNSTEIVVIGYSLAAADQRARTLILKNANKRASITICCGGDSSRIADEFVDAGFATVVADSCDFESWLNSLNVLAGRSFLKE